MASRFTPCRLRSPSDEATRPAIAEPGLTTASAIATSGPPNILSFSSFSSFAFGSARFSVTVAVSSCAALEPSSSAVFSSAGGAGGLRSSADRAAFTLSDSARIRTMSPLRIIVLRAAGSSRRAPRITPRIAASCSATISSSSRRRLPTRAWSSGMRASVTYSPIFISSSLDGTSLRQVGINRHPSSATKRMPVTATAPPTGAKSNIANGVPVSSPRMAAMMMLGGVPIRVTSPPRMEPKASGISSSEAGRPACFADCRAAGISKASAPTLFMNPDRLPATPDSIPTWIVVDFTGGRRLRAIMLTAPEFTSPRLATRTSATVTVAALANPENTSTG